MIHSSFELLTDSFIYRHCRIRHVRFSLCLSNYYYYYYYLFIYCNWVCTGGSSPTLVQTKTIKQHNTVVQHNTIKRKQHNTVKLQTK
jgi:hypothetical protein